MTKKNQPISDKNENQEPQPEEVQEELPNVDSGESSAESNPSLEEQLAAAKEESRQNHERYLRAVADWENYRRRMTREKEELRQHAISGLVEEFLPALDNLDLGLQTAANHPEAANVAKGFAMVADQIRAIFSRNGVSEINPEGEPFDPHLHESVSYQPHDELEEGRVIQVIRKGYSLNDKLLRAATVVVSSGPSAETDEA